MDTKFWNNLITGRKYEEEVANFFESQSYDVWRIGNFRLPVDLYVWDNKIKFFIEVKYRTNSEAGVSWGKLSEFMGRFRIPVFLIQISPTLPFVAKLIKSTASKRMKEAKSEGFSEEWIHTIKEVGDMILKIKIGTSYKELDWHELCTGKK